MEPKRNDKNNHVGIEIECYGMLDMDELSNKLEATGLVEDDDFDIVRDCSIKPPKSYRRERRVRTIYGWQNRPVSGGVEIRVLSKESALKNKLEKIFKVLKENKFKVNTSCGLHIHLDMRNKKDEVDTIYNNLTRCSGLFKKLQKKIRRNNRFCKDNEYKELWKESLYAGKEKYRIVNISAIGDQETLEVRIHHGSLDFKEVYGWINTLLTITKKKVKIKEDVKTVTDFKKKVSKSDTVNKYLQVRYKKYNKTG